jgi:hypothetical protein
MLIFKYGFYGFTFLKLSGRLFFLKAKRTKNLGAFRIRPEPLTGRGGVLQRLNGVCGGLPLHPPVLG